MTRTASIAATPGTTLVTGWISADGQSVLPADEPVEAGVYLAELLAQCGSISHKRAIKEGRWILRPESDAA